MKTRRKANEMDGKNGGDRNMAPRPEDSPVSSPRTRSPVKGVRTGGMSCSGPDALSMLNMLAEVASVTLHTDPSVTDTAITAKSKASSSATRKPVDYEVLTLEQVSSMTDNLLVKLFAEFESNEMWRRFTYTCGMLPAACAQYFQSFGSEHKARAGMKAHLLGHLKSLLEVHTSEHSRQNYILESVPARKRRLAEQGSSSTRKRGANVGNRIGKTPGSIKTPTRGENVAKRKLLNTTPEKENESKRRSNTANREDKRQLSVAAASPCGGEVKEEPLPEINRNEVKVKRKLETVREGKARTKKIKSKEPEVPPVSDDLNNNNNSISKTVMKVKVEVETNPPMQQVVSHDHGYLKAVPSMKSEQSNTRVQLYSDSSNNIDTQGPIHQLPQVSGIVENSPGIDDIDSKDVLATDDYTTLLHQHMNQELHGGIMAEDSGNETPLPVVGCEVEFTPDQQYKVMRSADLPIVYDHNNPPSNVQTVSRVIERDEYKVRKKPKGRAKFIGQSKVEKEMALKLITEIRSQPGLLALDTLECKICHPPRLFTAPSTLLSHYRSHAGIRPYECRICEAVFTRQHSLNYHMLIHTNQTRFTCVDCGRKFRHPSHFKEHRRRHTGESPYECSDCLMRFKTRNTYKRHLRTRHGKLLTTQGAIIILSQEEADRMKKTQGRKPRRPRQPLQIISPETAAQMEEEQVWTDFEEGDREEDDEDEFEEEDDESPKPESSMMNGADLSVIPEGMASAGIKQISNGKTGLFIRPKKVSISKSKLETNVIEVVSQGDVELSNGEINDTNLMKEERIEEEVVTEQLTTDDLQTYRYVFQPPPEHNTLPKVNIRSSWNTINIDLKNLEKATENVVTETICESISDGMALENIPISTEEQVINHQSDTGFPSDHVSAEEVITICAEETNGNIISAPIDQQFNTTGGKPDYFTVKKPLKCYGRPSYSILEPNGNVFPSGGSSEVDGVNSSSPHGVYLVEYIQGHDGRLAKVYHANAAVVNRNGQNVRVDTETNTVQPMVQEVRKVAVSTSALTSSTSPVTSFHTVKQPSKVVTQVSAKENSRFVSAVSTNGSTCATTQQGIRYDHGHTALDKVVVNKQVVSNVVVNNHIVKNGSVVSISSGKLDQKSLGYPPQSVVLSTVPSDLAQQVVEKTCSVGRPDINHIVTVNNNLSMENVEIIESLNPEAVMDTAVKEVLENERTQGDPQNMETVQVPQPSSKVKVEEVGQGLSVSVLNAGGALMNEFLDSQRQDVVPAMTEEEAGVECVESRQSERSTINSVTPISIISPALLPATVQV